MTPSIQNRLHRGARARMEAARDKKPKKKKRKSASGPSGAMMESLPGIWSLGVQTDDHGPDGEARTPPIPELPEYLPGMFSESESESEGGVTPPSPPPPPPPPPPGRPLLIGDTDIGLPPACDGAGR